MAVLEGLLQEVHRTRLHGANRHRHVAMSRHHDHRQARAAFRKVGLQLQPIHTGHAEVGQHASSGRKLRRQQLVRARIGEHVETIGLEQEPQRITHRLVVVHDMDRRCPLLRLAHRWSHVRNQTNSVSQTARVVSHG
jgi:hypothetical protein